MWFLLQYIREGITEGFFFFFFVLREFMGGVHSVCFGLQGKPREEENESGETLLCGNIFGPYFLVTSDPAPLKVVE